MRSVHKVQPLAFLFLLAIFFFPQVCVAQSSDPVVYEVRIEKLDSIDVSIRLPSAPATLHMNTDGTGSDDGFAGYVRNLTLSCGGRKVSATRTGAIWKTGDVEKVGPCLASYSVDLSFTRSKWEVGNEQAGYTDGHGTFLNSKAIFLESTLRGSRIIRFEIPRNWRLVTPWVAGTDGAFAFAENGMLEDVLAFGELNVDKAVGGPLYAELVTFGPLQRDTNQAARLVKDTAAVFNAMFPKSQPTKYLVVLLPGSEADGESYAHSFASTLPVPLDPDLRIVWGNTIAHEMFHYWCGGLIRADDQAAMEWFSEGFTEYYANLALIRSHQISTSDFLQKMAINIGQYEYFLDSPLFSDVTIEKAGLHKGRNRFGVYAGGWVMAFVLDQEIRRDSDGHRTLDDLMRKLLERTGDTRLTPAILLQAVGEFSDRTSDLLHLGISTRKSLHPATYLTTLGLKIDGQAYQAEFYIHLDSSADKASLQRRHAWAGF
jgi:predicted metalloprotease with PDZ domain